MIKNELPGLSESLWLHDSPQFNYPSLEGEIKVDVGVIGGGIAGITTAILLKDAGLNVAVIEAGKIGEGVTGHTTAKVTAAHNVIYNYLISRNGLEKTRQYARANQLAIDLIESISNERGISCDFRRLNCYVYTEFSDERHMLQKEAKAASDAGLKAEYTEDLEAPFRGAVKYEDQGEFHPQKYLIGLAQFIPGNGSHIFENTRALDINRGEINKIITDKGPIYAKNVVIATHYPFYDPGLLFTKMSSSRSYAIGFKSRESFPDAMFIGTNPTYTYRSAPSEDGKIIIASGASHEVGHPKDTLKYYNRLEKHAQKRFDIESVSYRWSTQDNMTTDKLPYIGKACPSSKNIYVATGFNKWGMTLGTVAAMLLKDIILKKDNQLTALFHPSRFQSLVGQNFIKHNIQVGKEYAKTYFCNPEFIDDTPIYPGQGKLIKTHSGKIAIYKDEKGGLHKLSPVCKHLGCMVKWNNAEKSWDCPCHGSRYDVEGNVIQAPAVYGLKKLD